MSDNNKLNAKQRLFCELFASDREFFGNGTQAYIEAYNIDATKKGSPCGKCHTCRQIRRKYHGRSRSSLAKI